MEMIGLDGEKGSRLDVGDWNSLSCIEFIYTADKGYKKRESCLISLSLFLLKHDIRGQPGTGQGY